MERLRAWLEGLNVRAALVWLKDGLLGILAYLWGSVKVCFSLKTTWGALALTFALAWCGGFWMGADKKAEAYSAMNAAIDRMREAKAAQKDLTQKLSDASARVKTLEGELEEMRKNPGTVPAPAPPPKPVARPKPKPAAAPPPEPSAWSAWFKN